MSDDISGSGISADEIVIVSITNKGTPYRLRISPYYLRIVADNCTSVRATIRKHSFAK